VRGEPFRVVDSNREPSRLQRLNEIRDGPLAEIDCDVDIRRRRAAPCRMAACAPKRYQRTPMPRSAASSTANTSTIGEGMRRLVDEAL
jgi:hypothetical protein